MGKISYGEHNTLSRLEAMRKLGHSWKMWVRYQEGDSVCRLFISGSEHLKHLGEFVVGVWDITEGPPDAQNRIMTVQTSECKLESPAPALLGAAESAAEWIIYRRHLEKRTLDWVQQNTTKKNSIPSDVLLRFLHFKGYPYPWREDMWDCAQKIVALDPPQSAPQVKQFILDQIEALARSKTGIIGCGDLAITFARGWKD